MRVVIVRDAECLLAIPFESVDEILGPERVVSRRDLPDDEIPPELTGEDFVSSRGRWLSLSQLLGGQRREDSQILVCRSQEVRKAYAVDQVLGLEEMGDPMPMPPETTGFVDKKYRGVRIWKDSVVLELDLTDLDSLE